MMTPQVEIQIGELDKSIVELSKRKLKLLKEVKTSTKPFLFFANNRSN